MDLASLSALLFSIAVGFGANAAPSAVDYEIPPTNPNVEWECGTAIGYEVNPESVSEAQLDAIRRGIADFTAETGHPTTFIGFTTDRRTTGNRASSAPVLIEFFWPEDAPAADGFSEPFVEAGNYVGGSIYLHDRFAQLTDASSSERTHALVMHEFGHIIGAGHSIVPGDVMHSRADTSTFTTNDMAVLRSTCDGSSPSTTESPTTTQESPTAPPQARAPSAAMAAAAPRAIAYAPDSIPTTAAAPTTSTSQQPAAPVNTVEPEPTATTSTAAPVPVPTTVTQEQTANQLRRLLNSEFKQQDSASSAMNTVSTSGWSTRDDKSKLAGLVAAGASLPVALTGRRLA